MSDGLAHAKTQVLIKKKTLDTATQGPPLPGNKQRLSKV